MKVECIACGKELKISEASSGWIVRVEGHECEPKKLSWLEWKAKEDRM